MKLSTLATFVLIAFGLSGVLSYVSGYTSGARAPTSAERMLADTWQRSADSTDRLIATLGEIADDTCSMSIE